MRHRLAAPFVPRLVRALAFACAATLGVASTTGAQRPSVTYRVRSSLVYTRFGYLDRTQKVVIPFQYDSAGDFSEGTALVFQEAKWRMIDTMGTLLGDVPDSVKFLSNVHGGALRVQTAQGAIGFLNLNGSYAIPPKFTMASDFYDGLALVEATGKTGPVCEIINRSGKVVAVIKIKVLACQGAWLDGSDGSRGKRAFSSGRVAVRAGPPEPDVVPPAPKGAAKGARKPAATPPPPPEAAPAPVATPAGAEPAPEANVVMLDTLGRLALKTRFYGLSLYSEGLSFADGGHVEPGRYIDLEGKVVIDSVDEGGRFSEGFAFATKWDKSHAAKTSHRKGILSRDGTWVTRPTEYDFAHAPFRQGAAYVSDFRDEYIVDTKGNKKKIACCPSHGMAYDGMVVVHWKDLPEFVIRYVDLTTGRFVASEDLYGAGGDFFSGRAAYAAIVPVDSVKKRYAAMQARLEADAKLYAPKPKVEATVAAKPVVPATKPGLWAWWTVRQGLKEFSDKGRQIWVDYMLFDAESGPTPEKLEAQARIPSRSLTVIVGSGALLLADTSGDNAATEILSASKLRLRQDMVTRQQLDRVSNNKIGRVSYQK